MINKMVDGGLNSIVNVMSGWQTINIKQILLITAFRDLLDHHDIIVAFVKWHSFINVDTCMVDFEPTDHVQKFLRLSISCTCTQS